MIPRHVTFPLLLACLAFLSACGTTLQETPQEEGRHLDTSQSPESEADSGGDIPEIVDTMPLPEPQQEQNPELYSVVALDVPVRELLFTVARDASINIDIHPDVSGRVSINAIDQSIPQILERLTQQVNIRWNFDEAGSLLVEPDTPYWRIYRIDYVNVQRAATTSADVSTSIVSVGGGDGGGGGGGGNNTSSATMNQNSENNFWPSLTANLTALLRDIDAMPAAQEDAPSPVIANPESGLVNVRATQKQHEEVSTFINFIQSRSLSQVLIEATVVEVNLSDRYQAGVDWAALARNSDRLNIMQNLTGANLSGSPATVLTMSDGSGGIGFDQNGNPVSSGDPNNPFTSLDDEVSATVSLLSEFGDLRVLSSPRIMALNNQAAMLRVVDNRVYFTIDVEPSVITNGTVTPATFTTNVETVPVGFVMTVTPQISDDDQVTLNVRPTISRILRFVRDPNPALAQENVVNEIPEIQIRELESVLKVYSGQIAVLGGLMQDSLDNNTAGVPVLSRMPGLGNLFSYRDDATSKTELIVFIRPIVVQQPSVNGDLEQYREYLPAGGMAAGN